MAKFNSGEVVERLEYDFTEHGGGSGVVTEPSTKTVNNFFNNMRGLIKEVSALQGIAANLENMDESKLAEQVGQIDEGMSAATIYQQKSIELIAELCGAQWLPEDAEPDDKTLVGGSPSVEELSTLPYRVLQAFTAWMMQEIRPKKTTPGSNG